MAMFIGNLLGLNTEAGQQLLIIFKASIFDNFFCRGFRGEKDNPSKETLILKWLPSGNSCNQRGLLHPLHHLNPQQFPKRLPDVFCGSAEAKNHLESFNIGNYSFWRGSFKWCSKKSFHFKVGLGIKKLTSNVLILKQQAFLYLLTKKSQDDGWNPTSQAQICEGSAFVSGNLQNFMRSL